MDGGKKEEEGPVVLALHRWDQSRVQFDPSEYREGFLSPTRELLLLHSLDNQQALLLPLSTDDPYCIASGSCKYEDRDVNSVGDLPSSSELVDVRSVSQLNSCRFITGVKSSAWGLCGDNYKQQTEVTFREFLFVVGSSGVAVHAFRQVDESDTVEGGDGVGRWTEWGPDSVSDSVSDVSSDKWMRSFLGSVETGESEGVVRTYFPEKSKVPCSATVVSFFISFNEPSLLGFCSSGADSLLDEGASGVNKVRETVGSSGDEARILSDGDGNDVGNTVYSCCKVFSSSLYDLVGFVLSGDSESANLVAEPSCKGRDVVVAVAVALLELCGLHWLFSIKLPQTGMNSVVEWVDFQISDKFLFSLNKFGCVLLHGAMSGEYIAKIDMLQVYGVKLKEERTLIDANGDAEDDGSQCKLDTSCSLISQTGNVAGKVRFQRLLVAPYSSLFTVVDECGTAYAICATDHVPEKSSMVEKLLPQYLRLGFLAPWDVGHCDIGHQKVFAPPPNPEVPGKSSRKSGKLFRRNGFGKSESHSIQNWHIQGMFNQDDLNMDGFSTSSCKNGSDSQCSHLARKFFLPPARLDKADTICFSPFGITRLIRSKRSRIVHTGLYIGSNFCDDKCMNRVNGTFDLQSKSEAEGIDGDTVGCVFRGCLYLITRSAISVVLPAVSVSSNFHPIDFMDCQSIRTIRGTTQNSWTSLELNGKKHSISPWQMAVLDRVLLHEGPDEADRLCLQNDWDLKLSRLRRLQLAMVYLKYEEMEQALEMLAEVNVAEEGIARLIFASIYMMVHRVGSDADVSAALRLLALATRFTIKMLRRWAVTELNDHRALQKMEAICILPSPISLPCKEQDKLTASRRLREMAYYLELIRNIQCQLATKYKRLGQKSVDAWQAQDLENQHTSSQGEYQLAVARADGVSGENPNQHQSAPYDMDKGSSDVENLALVPVDSRGAEDVLDSENPDQMSILISGEIPRRKLFPIENPKEMFARWEMENLDLRNIVKDALLSGRLPLAVLQLHLHRSKDLVDDKTRGDTFGKIRAIGRVIAYDLLLKGETALAVTTLQKLGEDIETSLKQLLFGTVSRSLRKQIAEEVNKYGFLKSSEVALLDRISLIERIYPSSNFWGTYAFRKRKETGGLPHTEEPGECSVHLLDPFGVGNLKVACGDIDGVVLGSWSNVNGISVGSEINDDSPGGYWAAAAVWAKAWDQTTIDRILLDQPYLLGVHVLWESQYEYYVCHNDWEEVSKALQIIPSSLVSERSLLISLDGLLPASSVRYSVESLDCGSYACPPDELDAVCIEIPNVSIFQSQASIMCSSWLRMLISEELAKRFIFLKEYWVGAGEMISLLAKSGFLSGGILMSSQTESIYHSAIIDPANEGILDPKAVQAFHKLVVHYCSQKNLPYFLDLYLDHHKLALNNDSASGLLEAAGDCQWAKWLLFSRIKGREYDASFSNARALSERDVTHSTLTVLEADEMVSTVDDIAESGWVMAALATLMFVPFPIETCLCSGSVKRGCRSSQCTLENLRPALQKFPTLWRTLLSACLGQDTTQSSYFSKGRNALSAYISWRDNVFYSSGRDTSLLQMLPCWFPKGLRRLIQLFIQGPLGWQSVSGVSGGDAYLQRDIELLMSDREYSEISPISLEEAIQKQIEQELYPSAVEDTGVALEQHLHRGRALAAFNQLLSYRIQRLNSDGADGVQPSASISGQANVQSDVQALLSPLTKNEEIFLSSVVPLAITHYQDSALVASCAFLSELCGLSATLLRVDIAALRRIHSFYKSNQAEQQNQTSSKDAALHTSVYETTIVDSLAQVLADHYLHQEGGGTKKWDEAEKVNGSHQPSPLMLVLQHLERASLLVHASERTCGSWLLNGDGDGNELRSQQKAASQHWSLVTVFCQMHQIPLSTVYLASLARDNDWVGFLSEAQVGGYPFDLVVQVAGKEFTDPRLKTHILTVLRGMESRKKATSPSGLNSPGCRSESPFSVQNITSSVDLFEILAQCEKQTQPGKALLLKAKELSWSLLAMIASCSPDVAPLSCLTVWLEITAAREISCIRETEIASQIANNVGAAVEASNALPACHSIPAFHYNRKTPKRRRLVDNGSEDFCAATTRNISSTEAKMIAEDVKEIGARNDGKLLNDSEDWPNSLSKLVALLCRQHQFLPLLRAFEMFLPSCCLLPFIRALQAFSQMRLSEASAHLGSFSTRIKEEPFLSLSNHGNGLSGTSWITSTAVKAADDILSACPSPYEKRSLLQLLSSTDFGDGGSAAAYYQRQLWKINLAEPALRKYEDLQLGNESLDDASLLTALENNGYWEQARNWARQLEASGGPWKSAAHHVTERQAESMVVEWKEFLWDVPEERVALWRHCQSLFIRYSFPAIQAGIFFLKHAEAVEEELPPRELHELLLLSLQWLSGMITESNPVCRLHLLREIETRVWLLAVESEAQLKSESGSSLTKSSHYQMFGNSANIVDQTADLITKMDSHINMMKNRISEKVDVKENSHYKSSQSWEGTKNKRRTKAYGGSRRPTAEVTDKNGDTNESSFPTLDISYDLQDAHLGLDASFSSWEERVGHAEIERAVLSLLEFGQITAAKQLQHKLSSGDMPFELVVVDAALKVAEMSTPLQNISLLTLDGNLRSLIQSYNMPAEDNLIDPLQILEKLSEILTESCGRGLCKRITAVVKAANILGISFLEAFGKQPTELLQLLSLKAQDSFDEARLLVESHPLSATSIANILAESFLKGLLAAHRGGYIDSQKEEGPAPLLWRFSDFLKWAELCPSEQEIGHALMRLVITGQEIPHACEVELLILSHHFYQSSACLDGVDVLVALAAARVDTYVSEGDFSCLARLITGVGNFHALNFILGILIDNGQLDLLLQKYSAAADANTGVAKTVRGFRMAVVTALKHFNPNDHDSFAVVYNHFDMKHETASLLESRAKQFYQQWHLRHDRDQNEDLLESMRFYIEAAEVYSSIDAGNKTHSAGAQASLVSLQIRMPDIQWLDLSETSARRLLVDQSRFQEALIVAEAYKLNQPSEWTPVLWNQMLKPEVAEQFMAEFVAVLPLHHSMLIELAKFYRSEMVARGDQSQFSVWLTGGGLPAEWAKYLGRSFRCLLKRTRDLTWRLQMAVLATGFNDVIDACNKALDKVPENAGPLVLRKGHGGAYLPLM